MYRAGLRSSFSLSYLVLAVSLGACGPTTATCPTGSMASGGRCVPVLASDAGVELADASMFSDDAASTDDAAPAADGGIDSGCTELTYFADADGDGVGAGAALVGCPMPPGHATIAGDCDDASMSRHPGAVEVCNGADDDCDTMIDERVMLVFYADADGDGHGTAARAREACTATAGFVSNADDCDDTSAAVRPGATEVCNLRDDDCDTMVDEAVQTAFYRDCDGDDFAAAGALAVLACTEPATAAGCAGGWTARAPSSMATTDCRQGDARAFPGQTMYFATQTMTSGPTEPLVGGFDFDCDRVTTQRYTVSGAPMCTRGATGWCGQSGWTDGGVPGCGISARLSTCQTTTCAESTATTMQSCR